MSRMTTAARFFALCVLQISILATPIELGPSNQQPAVLGQIFRSVSLAASDAVPEITLNEAALLEMKEPKQCNEIFCASDPERSFLEDASISGPRAYGPLAPIDQQLLDLFDDVADRQSQVQALFADF